MSVRHHGQYVWWGAGGARRPAGPHARDGGWRLQEELAVLDQRLVGAGDQRIDGERVGAGPDQRDHERVGMRRANLGEGLQRFVRGR